MTIVDDKKSNLNHNIFHVYNKGGDDRIIFRNTQDYQMFLSFLEEYLTPPKSPDTVKKMFQVKGRSFHGIPHQPKNYLNKVELLAYNLMPSHFHLLFNQLADNAVEYFMRSLCTRYSIYFNKKYNRHGSLFIGPYKSAKVSDDLSLDNVTAFFHFFGNYTSRPEYLGLSSRSWIKVKKYSQNYKELVERFDINQMLPSQTFANICHHLERTHFESDNPTISNLDNDFFKSHIHDSDKKNTDLNMNNLAKKGHQNHSIRTGETISYIVSGKRNLEFLGIASSIFMFLLVIGFRNVLVFEAKYHPRVLSVANSSQSRLIRPTQSIPSTSAPTLDLRDSQSSTSISNQPILLVIAETTDTISSVSIHEEPSTQSAVIGYARNKDVFQFVSRLADFVEVKLASSSGFIPKQYIKIKPPKE